MALAGRSQVAEARGYLSGTDFESAFIGTLNAVLEAGEDVQGDDSLSIGAGRSSREVLNYGFTLADGRDRLLLARPISAIGAIGRFVWMLSGSDRLADIAFYEPKVRPFSDDGVSVPGSDYGARLFRPRPGLDQVHEALGVLRSERGSRRAAAAVFHPEDAGRSSRDIPCTFGLLWHVRGDALHATTLMRSNNAWTLLPYNVFEFTLLAELMAADLGVAFGSYHHHAVSMHLYHDNLDDARHIGESGPLSTGASRLPHVPADRPFEKVAGLLAFETEVRYRAAALDELAVRSYLDRAVEMGPFWSDIAGVLVAAAVRNAGLADSVDDLLRVLGPPFDAMVQRDLGTLVNVNRVTPTETAKLEVAIVRSQLNAPPPGGND